MSQAVWQRRLGRKSLTDILFYRRTHVRAPPRFAFPAIRTLRGARNLARNAGNPCTRLPFRVRGSRSARSVPIDPRKRVISAARSGNRRDRPEFLPDRSMIRLFPRAFVSLERGGLYHSLELSISDSAGDYSNANRRALFREKPARHKGTARRPRFFADV